MLSYGLLAVRLLLGQWRRKLGGGALGRSSLGCSAFGAKLRAVWRTLFYSVLVSPLCRIRPYLINRGRIQPTLINRSCRSLDVVMESKEPRVPSCCSVLML
jgi:hypothetical protein